MTREMLHEKIRTAQGVLKWQFTVWHWREGETTLLPSDTSDCGVRRNKDFKYTADTDMPPDYNWRIQFRLHEGFWRTFQLTLDLPHDLFSKRTGYFNGSEMKYIESRNLIPSHAYLENALTKAEKSHVIADRFRTWRHASVIRAVLSHGVRTRHGE